MRTEPLARWMIAPVSLMVCLGIGACSDGDADDVGVNAPVTASSTTPPTTEGTPPPSELPTSDTAASGFYCGEFGDEEVPTLVAIDMETNAPAWKVCSESTIRSFMVGRTDGATILMEQNGRGGAELVGIDDTGIERWRRPTRMMNTSSNLHVGGDIAVVMTDEVEGIDGATGVVRWVHPVADGTPVGATDRVVIEVAGGPYALSTDVGDAPSPATMRAIDSTTGEERWTREIDLVAVPGGGVGQYSPTVGAEVIVVPNFSGNSMIVDIATGADLRPETGMVEANGPLLIGRDSMYRPTHLIDPRSGTRVQMPEGLPVDGTAFRGLVGGGSGLLLTSDPPTGPAATLRLVDTATGEVRWEIPYMAAIGGSDDQVFVTDGALLQVLDAADGTVAVEYRAPTDLATFASAVRGDGVVIAGTKWIGESPGGIPAGPNGEASEPPDCDGGPIIFDADVDGAPLVITESVDGSFFCAGDGAIEALGSVPNTPTPDPRFDSMTTSREHIFHIFGLPSGFDSAFTVVDERGDELATARGIASDYLVVIESYDGGSGAPPAMVQRTVEFLGPRGDVLARVPFSGLSADASAAEPAATFEDLVACIAEYGIQPPPPSTGGAPATVPVASSAEDLQAAWAACRDVFAGTLEVQGQGSPEFVENHMSQLDCMAGAGFYPIFAQPVTDEVAVREAYDTCNASMTGRIALVECLHANALAVQADGDTSGGPYPPELAAAAWAACRDGWIESFLGNSTMVDPVVGPMDCAAGKGWITPLMDSDERSGGPASADIAACRASTG